MRNAHMLRYATAAREKEIWKYWKILSFNFFLFITKCGETRSMQKPPRVHHPIFVTIAILWQVVAYLFRRILDTLPRAGWGRYPWTISPCPRPGIVLPLPRVIVRVHFTVFFLFDVVRRRSFSYVSSLANHLDERTRHSESVRRQGSWITTTTMMSRICH